jgi:2-methylisocitrate lyase-like PEP mutase family enzyme
MTTHAEKAARFLDLHRGDRPLLLANAWDVGSAKLLASLGYQALATTSSGYAASLGRLDYGAALQVASELMSDGTYSFTDLSTIGAKAARTAFAI